MKTIIAIIILMVAQVSISQGQEQIKVIQYKLERPGYNPESKDSIFTAVVTLNSFIGLDSVNILVGTEARKSDIDCVRGAITKDKEGNLYFDDKVDEISIKGNEIRHRLTIRNIYNNRKKYTTIELIDISGKKSINKL